MSQTERKSPFRIIVGGRGLLWGIASLVMLFAGPLGLILLISSPLSKHITGTFALLVECVHVMIIIGMAKYGGLVSWKEYADLVASAQKAPEEENLLIYIQTLGHEREEVRKQAGQVISVLLPRLSEDKLAQISNFYWQILCPEPGKSKERHLRAERDSELKLAVISAVMKRRRRASLPYIERLMKDLDTTPQSEEYVNALTACYKALQPNLAVQDPSATLLRASSAESASAEVLLRPVLGTSHTASGEQLLRVSHGVEQGVAKPKDATVSVSAVEPN